MDDYMVTLTPAKPNGRYRFVRVNSAEDSDQAIELAGETSQGWDVHTVGPVVRGADVPVFATINL